jgi:methylated-DNA-[protein]-cysteine S-methyltransferase
MEFIQETSVATELGEFTIRCSDIGVRAVRFGTVRRRRSQRDPSRNGGRAEKWARQAVRELKEYAAGRRRKFAVPLDLRGTEFQQKVWKALQAIPYGQTRSYGEIARQVGNPRAARAVGMANHDNPVAVIVPCHRVIAGDGSLGGYGGGLAKKSTMLRLEGADVVSQRGGFTGGQIFDFKD